MSEKEKWPKWFKITYSTEDGMSIRGFTGSASSHDTMYDLFQIINVKRSQIILMFVETKDEDGIEIKKKMSKEDIEKIYNWLAKRKIERERLEIEKSKKTK